MAGTRSGHSRITRDDSKVNDNRYAPPAADVSDTRDAPAGAGPERNVRRFFAAMLMLGGVAGVAIFVYMFVQFYAQGAATLLVLTLLFALFVWAIYVGWRLWQGTPYGRRWGVIAFATQIPVIAVPGFQCQWFTGGQIAPTFVMQGGSINMNLALNVGANGTFYLGSGDVAFALGANLFAVAAVIFLVRWKRREG
jgi:hypothetical protein